MNPLSIANVFGALLLVTGGSMMFPVLCALYYGDGDAKSLFISAILIMAVGLPLKRGFRNNDTLELKDGLFIACFGWAIISAFSALPFMIHGTIPSFTNAFFEMMSGYTTTGATILTDIESVPHGLLFWRSQTHLLGGMGFLTLTLIFLPHGVGGMRIFRAESSPGQVVTGDRFMARNRDTMVYLWGIYLALNIIQTGLLCFGGMSLFEGLCLAFATISTSGYSTLNDSVGGFHSAYVDWVTIVFMILGGVTFVLFYQVVRGNWRETARNTEFRWYIIILFVFCLATTLMLYFSETYSSFADALRFGTFQIVSILTTTGFITANYLDWPQAAQMMLVLVCFIGACAGSTTSGIKVVHYVLIFKYMYSTVKRVFIQPMSISSIRLNGKPVDASVVDLAICYFIVNFVLVFFGGMVVVLIDNVDIVTAMSAVVSCLMNIGPGFGDVGPMDNFYFLNDTTKWFLSWNMLVGRLEMFSALVVFYPAFWRE